MYQQLVLTGIMLVLVGCLFGTRLKPAWLFVGAIGISYLAGLISLEDMLINYANPSLITLILLVLVSIAVEKTTLVQKLAQSLSKGSLTSSVTKLGLSTAFLSSFTNNTAVVASLISAIKESPTHSPSKLLLPLSYTAILGGTITLIGTSTNLIVNGFAVEAGMEPLGFFDFTLIGLGALSVGLITILVMLKYLPDNGKNDQEVVPFYLEGKVETGSKLIGKSVEENGLRELKDLFLAEIIRGDKRICAVTPKQVIKEGDVLLFVGDIKSVPLLTQFDGLKVVHDKHEKDVEHLVEVVVSHSSKYIGKTIKEVRFREQFHAAVIAIRRGHDRLQGGLGKVQLQAGDSLILAPGKEFYSLPNLKREFVYISGLDLQTHLKPKQSNIVLASFATVLGLSIIGLVPLVKGLLVLLIGLMLTGTIKLSEVKRRFPIELLAVVGSAIGLAKLMIGTGLAGEISSAMLYVLGDFGPYGAFIAIFLMTVLFTELITNNAAAALSFPVAYALAVGFDVSPLPFIMAVAFGASASFISPFGYQTNLMVYSAGNYRLKDYIAMGLPLSIIYSITVLTLIPLVFPFQ
ncbi:SLC13 family permease [Pseudoalteromonas shioyasakiensis]|mgnify:FL=1|jgi:di/tricarboxylate transporter|uniref:SLC13 family permease n=1 Tax=Pseudoalteromonas TaxID=53246 RepID=UPI000C92A67A|nr:MULTISPECIES: SLC13 family permease [Pseudoalteromonas]MAD05621.1 SLC13 family permease [Pseudoalteromonas sp.]MCG9709204.1 SLC13 family permease [Pseudoalteromonas sp. Isolate3]MCP4587406.1 SLC13 family permease [Pseudoalteromonas sp.]MCQ8884022.1 SLC13 family permease [Pseudoalteromonas shioyasakiensis]QLE08157.1 SLC13 family permease [Pseudoalteromonas shioyasakiensis]|tara:strand:- start:3385 stop:5112 length:1728 start_codon:yes stop_codon:yes gene_type:complete